MTDHSFWGFKNRARILSCGLLLIGGYQTLFRENLKSPNFEKIFSASYLLLKKSPTAKIWASYDSRRRKIFVPTVFSQQFLPLSPPTRIEGCSNFGCRIFLMTKDAFKIFRNSDFLNFLGIKSAIYLFLKIFMKPRVFISARRFLQ